jgi:uncharacterized membrane protein YfcA
LSLLFGIVVGFSLGLTGGGGSIFAVPLLVYGLAMPLHRAVVASLAAVGTTALAGAIAHLHSGRAEFKTAVILALAGIAGAPPSVWLAKTAPPAVLLNSFALLMLLVAWRMWQQATRTPEATKIVRAEVDDSEATGPACRRDPQGALNLTSRCAVMLVTAGTLTGFLSGLFGVGGGFLIVPALIFVASLSIQRAVATSLLVIAIISLGGLLSHIVIGQSLALRETALFALGGLGGMGLGIMVGRRIAGPLLQKLFAGLMVAVAIFMLVHNLNS